MQIERIGGVGILHIGPVVDARDCAAYLALFEEALEAERPFATVFLYTHGAPAKDRAVSLTEKAWLKRYRSQFGEHCAGMAMVYTATLRRYIMRLIGKRAIQKIFGCPAEAFANRESAVVWAEQQLRMHRQPDLLSNHHAARNG